MMRLTIDLTDRQIEDVLVSELKQQYELASSNRWDGTVDQEYYDELRYAIELVLEHYMTPQEREAYFK